MSWGVRLSERVYGVTLRLKVCPHLEFAKVRERLNVIPDRPESFVGLVLVLIPQTYIKFPAEVCQREEGSTLH